MRLEISKLLVLQEHLRNPKQVDGMIEFVRNGGIWTKEILKEYSIKNNIKEAPLMEIVEFPDGIKMIHDGHHRCISTILGGRNYIFEEEYKTRYWSYEEYLEINFNEKWVTPFDPRTEIRFADIQEFKSTALNMDREKAESFILDNKHLYVKKREVYCLEDLVKYYEKSINNNIK